MTRTVELCKPLFVLMFYVLFSLLYTQYIIYIKELFVYVFSVYESSVCMYIYRRGHQTALQTVMSHHKLAGH